MIIHGDCLEKLKTLEDNSVDSVVTDPPYGLSFMGKKWDYDVPSEEIWRECLRVLKPGGHLLSFAGSRTYHRMAVRIEDAGFEIRDQIMWVYSTGFPKSLNVFKQLKKNCTCGSMEAYEQGTKTLSKPPVRPLQEADISSPIHSQEKQGEVLQSVLSEQSTHDEGKEAVAMLQFPNGREEPSLEGRPDLQKTEGELQRSDLSEVSEGVSANGTEGRLHNATSSSDGPTPWETTGTSGSRTSYRPQSEQQPDREPCAFCKQYGAQATRSYGIGSALKPAHEPIVVARKPISEKNLADNFLKWGVGGINIDGSRVEATDANLARNNKVGENGWKNSSGGMNTAAIRKEQGLPSQGRFPANLIHDGSEEVMSLFPDNKGAFAPVKEGQKGFGGIIYGKYKQAGDNGKTFYGDGLGSASRFFYCAKASKRERNMGCEGLEDSIGGGMAGTQDQTLLTGSGNIRNNITKNNHPTVKPLALMEYLIKLVSREGHTVLDPFMGSGTTGMACKKLNRDFIGIEREADYVKIANARINAKV